MGALPFRVRFGIDVNFIWPVHPGARLSNSIKQHRKEKSIRKKHQNPDLMSSFEIDR